MGESAHRGGFGAHRYRTRVLIPRALEVPSVTQLRDAKEALELEVFERKRAQEKLRQAQAELERRVAERHVT